MATKAGDLRAVNETLILRVDGMGTVAVQLVGTWVGTVSFYVSNTGDSGDYVAVVMTPPNATVGVASSTANGLWAGSVAGYAFFKVAMSAYTSGWASVLLSSSATGSGSGNGAGGVSTEYTEGDTDTSISGKAFLWEDAADTLVAVSAAKPLPIAVPTDPFGVNADAASVSTSISAKLKGIATALGITAFDLGTGTGGSRTLRLFQDTAQWIGGAGAVSSAVQRVTLPSDDPSITKLTSIISPGLTASVTITRPSDTTTYGALDVVGVTGGGTACMDFNLAAISGSIIKITSIRFQRDAAALIGAEAGYLLYLFSITQPGALADNTTFTVASGDQASYLGKITIPAPVDEGATLSIDVDNINKQVKLAGTHIFGTLVTVVGYQPASAAVHRVTLHAEQM